jgi:hypothetical protein
MGVGGERFAFDDDVWSEEFHCLAQVSGRTGAAAAAPMLMCCPHRGSPGAGHRRLLWKRVSMLLADARSGEDTAPTPIHYQRSTTMTPMAVAAKKLNIGDVVEIDGRRYDVVPDKAAGVTLEPAITQTVDEIHAELGTRPLTSEEFEEHFGDLPSDGEG